MTAGKRKRRYFIRERREDYLAALRRSGNHRLAAKAAGVSERATRRYRARKPEFEASCVEAAREAERRLAGAEEACGGDPAGEDIGAEVPRGGGPDPAFECIRRGADGRLKIQAQGSRRWSKAKEELFFDVLRECGNISASARAAGVSRAAVWQKRRHLPAFARRLEETMDEAEVALEFRVACLGTNWADDSKASGGAAEAAGVAEPPPQAREAFDPDLALRFLKWRSDLKSGRRRAAPALPAAAEVRERIVRKVEAIKRHKAREAARRAVGDSGRLGTVTGNCPQLRGDSGGDSYE